MTTTVRNGNGSSNGTKSGNRKPLTSKGLGGRNRSMNALSPSGQSNVPVILAQGDIQKVYDRNLSAKKADGKPVHSSPYLATIKDVMASYAVPSGGKLPPEVLAMVRAAAGKSSVAIASQAVADGVNAIVTREVKFSALGHTREGNEIYVKTKVTVDTPLNTQELERAEVSTLQASYARKADNACKLVKAMFDNHKLDPATKEQALKGARALLEEHKKFQAYAAVLGHPVDNLAFWGVLGDMLTSYYKLLG